MSTLHPDIERLALLGWRLHPASRSSRAAAFKDAAYAATHDLDKLAEWTRTYPHANWRVVMAGSGIWALDVDAPGPDHQADGIKALVELVARYGELPPRPMTRSGGGGFALFFRHDGEPIIGRTGTPSPGIDPRRGPQTVTVPPSIHLTTRKPYRWITAPWELSPAPAPAWLLKLVAPPPEPPLPAPTHIAAGGAPGRAYALAALRREVETVSTAPPGQRNDRLNRACWSVARFIPEGLLEPSEIAEALAHAGRVAGLDRVEVARTLASGLKAGARR
jgi:hypothetical protein